MSRGVTPQPNFSLADQLFNPAKTAYIAGLFASVHSSFDRSRFESAVNSRLPDLELKARAKWIAQCLLVELPETLSEAAPILRAALPPPLDPTKKDDDFGDFIIGPFGDVVLSLGLDKDPDLVLDLLGDITQRFSMEFAVRPMLNRWPHQTLARMRDWARADNYHLRRLASEGSRPKLPWGQGITTRPEQVLDILDMLHADETRYVTRSVANHVNDISKIDADMALDRLEAWGALGQQQPKELVWMTGHSLRGLIKAGHPRALRMIGFDPDAAIELCDFNLPASARIGDALRFSFVLCADHDCGALVDYVLWRRRANGNLAPKVYKLKKAQLRGGVDQAFDKSHKLKGDATTFRLYPGPHRLSVQVNGRILAERDFDLS